MTQRYYSLYEKQGRRWIRLSEMGFKISLARTVWQNNLISQVATRPGPNHVPTTGELMLRPIRTLWHK